MSGTPPLLSTVTTSIYNSFASVSLGDGISLRQAVVIGNYGEGYTDAEFEQLKQSEVVDDWTKIPPGELENDDIAHLDSYGFRYYIPALMLSVLRCYDSGSMRVIGTLSSLYPKKDSWVYHISLYQALTFEQKHSIAQFLEALPELVPLDFDDQKIVERSLRNYWTPFLPFHIPPAT